MTTRRRALFGAGSALGCASLACSPAAALSCDDVTTAPVLTLSPADRERHGIFLLLAMAMVFDGWGVDRSRPEMVEAYAAAEPGRVFADYAGHNIGAILVDRTGMIVCGGLNRNVALNSTMAHAEARTVARAIDLANAGGRPRWSFGGLLEGDVLYTTLEPCSQCSGIMELANLAAVVYGQDDPAQHKVATVLYNLRRGPNASPGLLPIRADFAPFWTPLAVAYDRFEIAAVSKARTGLTSFLQTVEAYRVYRDAAAAFARLEPGDPENRAVLDGARNFRKRWRNLEDGAGPPWPPCDAAHATDC